jgi:hypothetical protein
LSQNALGSFSLSSKTASSGTAFASLVPPYRGPSGSPPLLYKLDGGKPNWIRHNVFTHISQLVYTAGSTAHDLVIMRPLNWAVINGNVAANSSTIVLTTDPGVYSTNYKYDLPPSASGLVSCTASNAIAASDYVAYQLRDGTWVLDLVSSVSGLTLTMTTATPNITGGGIADGSILFFFGVAANVDPATGLAHQAINSVASARTSLLSDLARGTVQNFHPGDPMVLYSANASNAGILSVASGFYAQG